MSVLTVRAPDSATAMDEVIRRLGPDAMILSTRARNGQVEITASDGQGPVAQAPQPPAAVAPVPVPGPVAGPVPEAPPPRAHGFAAYLARAAKSSAAAAAPVPPGAADAVLAAPRVVLAGPLGAGKSSLAVQIAEARLARAEALGAAPPASGFVFCGSGSHGDGAWLAQKAWLLGASIGFADAATLGAPRAEAPDLVVVSDLHADPVGATRAVLTGTGATCVLVLPMGLRAERLAGLAARWRDIADAVVVTGAPDERFEPAEAAALTAAGLAPTWISRRGVLTGGLADPGAPADTARRAPMPFSTSTLTDLAG